MIKGRAPNFGRKLYPTSSARATDKRLGVTPLLRCVQCGAVNDSRSTGYSEAGDGISVGDGGDPVVSGGCWFCGSMHWRRGRPPVLPDDRNLSDGHVKKRRR